MGLSTLVHKYAKVFFGTLKNAGRRARGAFARRLPGSMIGARRRCFSASLKIRCPIC